MTDKKISELTAAGVLIGTEEIPIVQSGSTVRTTIAGVNNMLSGGMARVIAHADNVDMQPGVTPFDVAMPVTTRITSYIALGHFTFNITGGPSTGQISIRTGAGGTGDRLGRIAFLEGNGPVVASFFSSGGGGFDDSISQGLPLMTTLTFYCQINNITDVPCTCSVAIWGIDTSIL